MQTATRKPDVTTPKASSIQHLWYTLSPQEARDKLGELYEDIQFCVTNYGAAGTLQSVSFEETATGAAIHVVCTYWPLDRRQPFAKYGVAEMQLATIILEAIRTTLADQASQDRISHNIGSHLIGVTDDGLLPQQAAFSPDGITTTKPSTLSPHTLVLPYKLIGYTHDVPFAYRSGSETLFYEDL